MESNGWIVGDGFFVRKLPLVPFSVLKYQRWDGEIDIKKYEQIKKKHRVIFAALEPTELGDLPKGFKMSSSPFLPTKTVVVDLTKSEDQLLKAMSKDARQRLRLNDKFLISNIESMTNDQMPEFLTQWRNQQKGYVPSLQSLKNLKKSFGDKCLILTADMKAGVVILFSDDTAFYYFAWTNAEGREMGAQYQLVWEAMKKAKKLGLKKFDFEGIYDERWPLPRWKGFTGFKKKWGGEEISFPGSYQKWL